MATLTTGVLNIPNNTYTEIDTLQSVCARASTTSTSITMTGSGASGYLYVTGNAQGNQPTNSTGMAFSYNNNAGLRENELFWNPGIVTAADNATFSFSLVNEYLDSANSNARVSDRLFKLYGNGNLELTGPPSTSTIANTYWRMPKVAGSPGQVLARSSATIDLEWVANSGGSSLVYTQAYTAANLFTGGTQAFNVTGGVPVGKQLLIENLVYYLDYGGTSFDYISTDEIKIIYLDGFSSNNGPKINGVDTFMNTIKDVMTEGYFAFSASIFPHLLGGVVVGASPGSFELSLPTATPTVGNGTLYVSMQYKLLDTGASFSL